MADGITRREALQRAAWLLGGTLSAPTILAVLAGCGDDRGAGTRGQGSAWTPRTLSPEQRAMVVAIAEAIIPTTDTPGARDARVDEFVDAMLSDHYPAKDRDRFLAGLARIDARAQREHTKNFNALDAGQQSALIAEMDRVAFSESRQAAEDTARVAGAEGSARVRQGDVAVGQGTGPNPAVAATPLPDPADVGPQSFFRMMKELVVVGYYTSEVGATRELRVNPMTRYRDIPYTSGMPGWA